MFNSSVVVVIGLCTAMFHVLLHTSVTILNSSRSYNETVHLRKNYFIISLETENHELSFFIIYIFSNVND